MNRLLLGYQFPAELMRRIRQTYADFPQVTPYSRLDTNQLRALTRADFQTFDYSLLVALRRAIDLRCIGTYRGQFIYFRSAS